MSRKYRIIPFSLWPANWGLTGSRRAKALAEYYYDGEDLAYQLLDIDFEEANRDDPAYRTAKLKLDYRYHKISEFDYGLGLIENNEHLSQVDQQREIAKYLNKFGKINEEELEYKLFDLSHTIKDTESYIREKLKLDVRFGKKSEEQADRELLDIKYSDKNAKDYKIEMLALDLKWGKISENEHDKQIATLNREPWFNIMGADKHIKGENVRLSVELDWNEFFIEFLEKQGWTGMTPDEIVDRWFEGAMRQMLDIDIGDEVDMDDGSSDPMPIASAITRKTKGEDGLSEYR